jgi:hypothetical protein
MAGVAFPALTTEKFWRNAVASPADSRLIEAASRQIGMLPIHLQALLSIVAGVKSVERLPHSAVNDVMAVLEDYGFREEGVAADFWRSRLKAQGSLCGRRLIAKILSLRSNAKSTNLPAGCREVTQGRVDRIDRLTPGEALALIGNLSSATASDSSPHRADAACEMWEEILQKG